MGRVWWLHGPPVSDKLLSRSCAVLVTDCPRGSGCSLLPSPRVVIRGEFYPHDSQSVRNEKGACAPSLVYLMPSFFRQWKASLCFSDSSAWMMASVSILLLSNMTPFGAIRQSFFIRHPCHSLKIVGSSRPDAIRISRLQAGGISLPLSQFVTCLTETKHKFAVSSSDKPHSNQRKMKFLVNSRSIQVNT